MCIKDEERNWWLETEVWLCINYIWMMNQWNKRQETRTMKITMLILFLHYSIPSDFFLIPNQNNNYILKHLAILQLHLSPRLIENKKNNQAFYSLSLWNEYCSWRLSFSTSSIIKNGEKGLKTQQHMSNSDIFNNTKTHEFMEQWGKTVRDWTEPVMTWCQLKPRFLINIRKECVVEKKLLIKRQKCNNGFKVSRIQFFELFLNK